MYKIEDFHTLYFETKTISLSSSISAIFDEIQANIVSVLPISNKVGTVSHWERNKSSEKGPRNMGSGINHSHRGEKVHYSHSSKRKKDIPADDWEQLRNFKTTKVEEPVKGVDKDINDIRISLNKISVNNYAIQKEAIISKMMELQNQSPKKAIQPSRYNLECWEDDEEEEKELPMEVSPAVDDANLVIVANAIFDIASSNKFFSDLYAELYRELAAIFPIFRKIALDFLVKYKESLPKISYVDPNIDYDGFCVYTKENDVKKATSTFIVNLMKKGILPVQSIMDIILHLHTVLLEYIDTMGKLNEVEELAENWGILITNTNGTALVEEPAWVLTILPALTELSQMKPVANKSLSNRAIFKWMNILDSL